MGASSSLGIGTISKLTFSHKETYFQMYVETVE